MVYYEDLDPKMIITFYDDIYRREGYHGKTYSEWVEMIKVNGITQPVEVQFDGEKYKCIDGHMRVMVARDLGIEKIPAVVLVAR